jgi:hypothetical protein
VCGRLEFVKDVSYQLQYGTYACPACCSFLSPLTGKASGPLECREGKGVCLLLPGDQGQCRACWLLLALLGCQFQTKLFAKLEALLPATLRSHPDSNADAVVNAGKILVCSQSLVLDRPLTERSTDSVSSSSVTSEEVLANFSKGDERRSVVTENLPNGWRKKAVRRVKGSLTGKWDVYLITPDRQVLRSSKQLKVLTAKTGAVIDSNVVNFNLPQRTHLVSCYTGFCKLKTDQEKAAYFLANKLAAKI